MDAATILTGDILGLDLGKVKTGVARIHTIARIAEPLTPIQTSDKFADEVKNLLTLHQFSAIVVGVPRGLDTQSTDQTKWTLEMVERIKNSVNVPVFTIDEAGTTKQAEEIAVKDQSVDSVAAGIMLEDFLRQVARGAEAGVSI